MLIKLIFKVRTWFQNRRMKLRRHQKDTSWVSERYTINNGTSVQGTVYNIPPYSTSVSIYFKMAVYTMMFGQVFSGTLYYRLEDNLKHGSMIFIFFFQYQGESQHRMDAAFKNTPQNVAFYMATMAPGSTGYPSWTTVPCQTAVPIRTQQLDWPTNPHVFNVAGFANDQCTSFESKNGEAIDRS